MVRKAPPASPTAPPPRRVQGDWVTRFLTRMRDTGRTRFDTTEGAETDWLRHIDDLAAMTLFPLAESW